MKYKIVITAGGTSEKIDNVRKITNSSSGKLGLTIANKLIESECVDKIYYVASKTALKPNHENIEIIEIGDTNDLKVAVEKLLTTEKINYFIHSMAVSDYTVDYVTTPSMLCEYINEHDDMVKSIVNNKNIIKDTKISSSEENLIIMLKQTPKIISLIKKLSPSTKLIGFKLLDSVSKDKLIDVAYKLLEKNNCDYVVANDLNNIRKGQHIAYIIDRDKNIIDALSKEEIATVLKGLILDD